MNNRGHQVSWQRTNQSSNCRIQQRSRKCVSPDVNTKCGRVKDNSNQINIIIVEKHNATLLDSFLCLLKTQSHGRTQKYINMPHPNDVHNPHQLNRAIFHAPRTRNVKPLAPTSLDMFGLVDDLVAHHLKKSAVWHM